mgnify:FL=1
MSDVVQTYREAVRNRKADKKWQEGFRVWNEWIKATEEGDLEKARDLFLDTLRGQVHGTTGI